MEFKLLQDIVIIFTLSVLVIFLFQKIKIHPIIGFLITGIIAGPFGFGLVQNVHEIEVLAELGVILLLFTIGIEFSMKTLIRIRRLVFIGGVLQVGLTILITFFLMRFFNFSVVASVFSGFLVALSSTAIVLKVVQGKGEISSPHGQLSMGFLIFQDIIIVPMILFTPLLAGAGEKELMPELFSMILKMVLLLLVMIVSAKWLVPRILHETARTRNRELFLLVIFVIGFAVAWFSSILGLSLALGAFLAGLTISESDYGHHAFGNIMPFRDIFASFFFVSIGMLLDLEFFLEQPLLVLLISVGILLLKTLVNGAVAFVMGFPFRTTVIVGLSLSQIGEFSFVLSKIGMDYQLLDNYYYQLFINVTIFTMAFTPLIINGAPWLSDQILKLNLPEKMVKGLFPIKNPVVEDISNHVIIAGMGFNGHNIARGAKYAGIPYIIVDLDAEIVHAERKRGEPVFYGDASQESTLEQVHVDTASIAVVTLPDAVSTFSTVELIRKMNPAVHIIVRTRFINDVNELYKLGANEVFPEEFETSIEIFSRVLTKMLIPRGEIEKMIAELRSDGYEMFREIDRQDQQIDDIKLHIPEMEMAAIKVEKNSTVAGKTLKEIDLRQNFGVTLLAIHRNKENLVNPKATEKLCYDDILYILGDAKQIACASSLFKVGEIPDCMDEEGQV